MERHRLQYLVFRDITRELSLRTMRMLHFAPEDFFRELFRAQFGEYVTADITGVNVDRKEDVTAMSFTDDSFDFLYASHVLEHVQDDAAAQREIR